MISLGIYNLGADPSAAIIKDGKVIAYVEEERLIRQKHADWKFPIKSIIQAFSQTNLSWNDIDNIAIPWDCHKYDNGIMETHYNAINRKYKIRHPTDLKYEKSKLSFFQSDTFKAGIIKNLKNHFGNIEFPPIDFVGHHFSHACATYFSSYLTKALVVILDGSGEDVTVSVWVGSQDQLKLIKQVKTPISLGWFYSAVTEYLGFSAYSDEWQVMGLACYGKNSQDFKRIKRKLYQIIHYDGQGGITGRPDYLCLGSKSISNYYSDKFLSLMGKAPRFPNEEIDQFYRDFALAAQKHLEEIVTKMIKFWIRKTDIKDVCLAGGVAMNVKMNGEIFKLRETGNIFVYPIAADAGTSIGAGMAHQYKQSQKLSHNPIHHVYLGNNYSDIEIESFLKRCKLKYTKSENIEKVVAKAISDGKIAGWFQIAMEGGQRALGARSILADPRNISSRDLVNSIIKYRQPWRPFCPSVLPEALTRYFGPKKKIEENIKSNTFQFMTLTLRANKRAFKEIPAVIHIDGTCRVQLVTEDVHTRYFNLLREFKKITSIGAVLNTSFNIKGEPIVCSPLDAIRTFYATGLDILAIGNCILTKDD